MRVGKTFCEWVIGVLMLACVGCIPRQENEVVLYCSVDREYATPILDAFERIQGSPRVARMFDIESTKTLGLATRILQEQEQTRCDVFWSGEILHTIRLQRAGLLQPIAWELPPDWPSDFVARDKTWVGLGGRGRVLLVNKNRLPDEGRWPRKVNELSEPQWKGKCGMAKPLYGTTATHMSVLASHVNAAEQDFSTWLKQVKENAIILSGNKQVAQAVANGEIDWGLTDSDDAAIEITNGSPVAVVYPDQAGPGMLLIPGTIAILRHAPHPLAAHSLASYLASEKTESRLTLGNAAQFALWPESAKSIGKSKESLRIMEVNFEMAANQWETLFATLQSMFE